MVFLKGYQWPFDSKKVLSGSSIIDLLVYKECVLKKRKVFLDFTKNPFGFQNIEYKKLKDEAFDYLNKAEACFGTPIERLLKMNSPAVELYKGKGLDITKEYLEIALCAQHNNGGIAVDMWWQTCVKGLFAAGECAGTHGVTRPGGSALNAGQVGSLRAAQYIGEHGNTLISDDLFENIANQCAQRHYSEFESVIENPDNADNLILKAQRRMSDCASAIRNCESMKAALAQTENDIKNLSETAGVKDKSQLYNYYKLRDILITQSAVLSSFINYSDTVGDTRGSSLYFDKNGKLRRGLEELFRFSEENEIFRSKIQETYKNSDTFCCSWRDVRPIPDDDDFFENIWRSYRENKNIY